MNAHAKKTLLIEIACLCLCQDVIPDFREFSTYFTLTQMFSTKIQRTH